MTIPTTADGLTEMLRTFMASARKYLAAEGPGDPIERALAAITLAITAIVVAWPKGKKAPKIAQLIGDLARQLWARRHLFDTPPTS